jgi:hypothetical protein
MAWFISIIVALHFIWAGIGTAYLLRDLGASKFGQAIGGLAFSLSGYLIARAGFLSINTAAAWLPWLLLSLSHLVAKRSDAIVKLTGVLAMLFLSGHAQTTWISLLLGGFWLIYWSVVQYEDRLIKKLSESFLGFIGAGFIALGISAVQIIPTAEYLIQSQRAGEYGLETAMTYSFWPWRFLGFILPELFGNPGTGIYWGYGNYWEDAIYIGLFPLLLAVGSIVASAKKARKQPSNEKNSKGKYIELVLTIIILISFIIALGSNTAVFPFLYQYIPGFDLFQAPTRYSIMALMALAILAGLGASQLRRPQGKALYSTRLTAVGCFSISAGAVIAGALLPEIRSSFLYSAGKAGFIGMLFAVTYLIMPENRESEKARSWYALVISLVCLDLISAGWALNPGVDLDFYDPVARNELSGRVWLQSDTEYSLKFDQFFTFESFNPEREWQEMHNAYLPNLPMLSNAEMVNNFDPLIPGFYQDWMDGVNAQYPDEQILELMNVGGVVDLDDAGNFDLRVLDRSNQPVRVAGCEAVLSPEDSGLEQILESKTNMLDNLFVISEEQKPCIPDTLGSVKILDWRNGHLILEVDLDQAGWIFWSQVWYPGWKYQIDEGAREKTYRVNYLFQGAPVPAGSHQVEFVYRPASVLWGSVITVSSLILGTVWIPFMKSKKKR